ncbi:MAG: NAD(P)-dependent dehydrogenase (short-subunit alcohol dehydrogenase family) [Flavobacterium sp.]|jgi:NAD(P)-dependent dehydrogenase (short-subunit alcohol dehydrogenase family)
MSAKRLQNKRVVIIGAGQTLGDTIGNGRAMALLFAREGASIFCVDRDIASANETVDKIVSDGGQACAFQADITSPEDCSSLITEAERILGSIDILVNNVGVGDGDRKVAALSEDVWDRIFDVNLKAMWMVSKQVLAVMKKQEHGVIINISSIASQLYHGGTAYEVSKAGVNKLTESIAAGYAKYGIRCNAVLPGLMDTPMAIEGTAKATGLPAEKIRERRASMVPLQKKQGSAWDTASAALFLASDEAAYITGALLPVDGGMSLKPH